MSQGTRQAGLVALLAALVWGVGLSAAPLAPVDRVWPIAPPDGAVTGPRTVFEIGYGALGDPHPRELRFRIRLDPTREGGRSYVFDQRRRASGWLVGEQGRVLYRPRKALDDGEYRWQVGAWNGVEWVESPDRHAIRIDSVPPGDVDGLQVKLDREAGHAILEWPPVTLDRDGRPEFVQRYHVYRYERGGPFRRVRVMEIAVVEQPRFVDIGVATRGERILYYQVTAEDEAGNEGGVR
jgi:hypothetical protein